MKSSKPKSIPHVRTRPRLGAWPHGLFNDKRSHIVQRTGRVVLRGVDKANFRMLIYRRAGGHCEIAWDGKVCGKFAAWDGLNKGDLVHLGGTLNRNDVPEQVQWGCHACHMRRDHPGLQWTKKGEAA